MYRASLIVVVLAMGSSPLPAQEWLGFGHYPWGFRFLEEVVPVGGDDFVNQLQVWYPATVEGEDVPAAEDGPFPVIFFQHAGGSDYSWYDYQFSRLASRGFIVVSIRHDHETCALSWWTCHAELYHLNIGIAFENWNVSPTHFLFDRLDQSRIGVAGHSHGAAFLVAQELAPMDPGAAYEIQSVCLIAPCPNVPIAAYADEYADMPPLQVIYGSKDECSCTGTGQGIAIYDPASRPRHHAYVIGANHWAFCEGGSLGTSTITRLDAWRASAASMAAFHAWVHQGDPAALPYLRGELPLVQGSPEVRYQFEEPNRFVIDDFDNGPSAPQPGGAITGIAGQTYVNGFLGDAFVDFDAGVELIREEIRQLVPTGGCADVLFYRDGTVGPDAYTAALDLEVAAGLLCPYTFTASQPDFADLITTSAWDLIIAANQTGSAGSTHPFDAPLADYICAGGKAIVSDFRVFSPTALSTIQCAETEYDGETNWSTMTSTGSLFSGTLDLENPGWGIWTTGLTANGTAVVHATNETTISSIASDPSTNGLGLPVIATGWLTLEESDGLQPSRTLYHPSQVLELAWSAAGATYTSTLSATGGFDATEWRSLSFRILQEFDDPLNPLGTTKDLHVTLEDGDGDSAELTLSAAPQGELRPPSEPDPSVGWKSIFESYRFGFDEFISNNPALDLDRLVTVGLVCDLTPTGRCFIDDIAFDGYRVKLLRGDCNSDLQVNLGDAIFTLDAIFGGLETPTCDDACDSNDDASIDIADAITLLSYLFIGGLPPASPYPNCGSDDTLDALGCRVPRCP